VAIDIRPEVLIHRTRPDVASFMFNPANDLAWTGGITASIQPSRGLSGWARRWSAQRNSSAARSATDIG
jgi:hypothetical protein